MTFLKIKNGNNKFDNYKNDYIAPLKAASFIVREQFYAEAVDNLLSEMERKTRYAAEEIESLSAQIAAKMESKCLEAKRAMNGELVIFNRLGELQSLVSAYDVAMSDFCAREEILTLFLRSQYSDYFEMGFNNE